MEYMFTCWRLAGLYSGDPIVETYEECMRERFKHWRKESRQLATMLSWAIWRDRNDLVWNQRNKSAKEVVALANSDLEQWSCAQEKTFVSPLFDLQPEDGNEHWSVPVGNKIKVNVDAAIFEERRSFGVGWVVRKADGMVVEARTRCMSGKMDPGTAEAIEVKEVLSWIKTTGGSDMVVETDSLLVVQAIRSRLQMPSGFGYCIEECRQLLSSLNNVQLYFVKRSANRVAHCLARSAWLYADRIFSDSSIPSDVYDAVLSDLSY